MVVAVLEMQEARRKEQLAISERLEKAKTLHKQHKLEEAEKVLEQGRQDNANGELGQTVIFTCHKRMLRAAKKLEMTDGIFRME